MDKGKKNFFQKLIINKKTPTRSFFHHPRNTMPFTLQEKDKSKTKKKKLNILKVYK